MKYIITDLIGSGVNREFTEGNFKKKLNFQLFFPVNISKIL